MLDKPPEGPTDWFYLKAFDDLSTERQYGQGGMGPIPWSRIRQYAQHYGLDAGMTKVFDHVIRSMDEDFLKENMKKRDGNRQ